jgi:type IV pilus assembly protein PilV
MSADGRPSPPRRASRMYRCASRSVNSPETCLELLGGSGTRERQVSSMVNHHIARECRGSPRLKAETCRSRGLAPQNGVSLIEILVTLIIVAVGLLGLAATQAAMQEADFESYQRGQALLIANDMLDRITSNRYAAPCYAITPEGDGEPYLGTAGAGHLGGPACVLGSATAEQVARADQDLLEWNALLQGAAEIRGGANVGAMAGARGCVSFDAATDAYTVMVAWQGRSRTFAPVVECGSGLYGDETQRRTVWMTLRIADLL